jgi:tripeptide aminopeptidase
MNSLIIRRAQEMGATIEEHKGNLYIVKGRADLYPCIVAHTDTVHRILPDKEYRVRYAKGQYFAFNHVKGEMTGIGGDDKVGIFIALSMLEQFEVGKVAFFRDEEVGCVGSRLANMSFFEDVAFVLECDRLGNQDFVKSIYGTELYGDDFGKAVAPLLKRHGYREHRGGITDVGELKENGLGVACANMSCGYYNPHTKHEYIDYKDMRRCMDLVRDIWRNLGTTKWEHEYKAPVYKFNRKGGTTSYYNSDWWEKDDYGTKVPYGSGARYIAQGNGLVRVITDDAEEEDTETFGDLSVLCPVCQTEGATEYDNDVGFYYCQACSEYIIPLDDDETDAHYRVLEDADIDDPLAASDAILAEWSAEDIVTNAIKKMQKENRQSIITVEEARKIAPF